MISAGRHVDEHADGQQEARLRISRKTHFVWITSKKFSASNARQVLVGEDPGEDRAGRDQQHDHGVRQAALPEDLRQVAKA
jgi:hypothetical protein